MAVKKGTGRLKAPIEGDAAVEAVLGEGRDPTRADPTPADPTPYPSPQSGGYKPAGIVERGDVYGRIARARRMTPAQRKKAEKDRQRSKVTYDWPEELIREVERLAREVYYCPASHLAAALAIDGLEAVREGRLDIRAMRRPANSPRFDWYLELEYESADGAYRAGDADKKK